MPSNWRKLPITPFRPGPYPIKLFSASIEAEKTFIGSGPDENVIVGCMR